MTKTRTRRADRPATRTPPAERRTGYAALSTQPLHMLAFLLPILIVFEVGLLLVLTSPDGSVVEDIRARRLLAFFFDLFGAPGLSLAPLAAVVILLVQHAMRRDSWRVRPGVVGLMALESVAWAIPLFVLGQVVYAIFAGVSLDGGAAGGAPAAAEIVTLATGGAAAAESGAPWWLAIMRDLTRAAGAGLYEELVFRLAGVTLLHIVLADLLRVKKSTAAGLAVALSAVAFAAYHDVSLSGGGVNVPAFAFFFVAGVYFGVAFLTRGFGIAVGLHVAYDLLAFSTRY